MKNYELKNIGEALIWLGKQDPKHPRYSFRVAHVVKLMGPHLDALNEVERTIYKEFTLTNDKGEAVDLDGKLLGPGDELNFTDKDAMIEKLKELMETEITIDPLPRRFTMKDFLEAQITPRAEIIAQLGPLADLESFEESEQPAGKAPA